MSTSGAGWRSYAKVAVVVLSVSLVVHFVQHGLWLTGLETAALDSFLVLRAEPQRSPDMSLVVIDDEDYRQVFDATSPLSPKVLAKLLDAVAGGGAQVIGVDLDTSDPRFQALAPSRWPQAVWAREADVDEQGMAEPLGVLGGVGEGAVRSGVAAVPLDADCRVRRFRRAFRGPRGTAIPSFPLAVLAAAGRGRGGKPEAEVELNLFGDRFRFDTYRASDVMTAAQQPSWHGQHLFASRIVLVGGTYRAGRDAYFTAMSEGGKPRHGVEITADEVQTLLDRRGIRPVNKLVMVGVEVLASLLIVFLNHWARERRRIGTALALSLAVTFVAAPAGSLIAFSTFAYWANFVPILLGVTIHQLYDQAEHYRRLLQVSAPAG